MHPLVSIICLCHNQRAFVKAALQSVWSQTYLPVELIIVDDGSIDGSKEVIKEQLTGKDIRFIDIPEPIGHCKAFNLGFRASRGCYLIDLAADDELLPARVEEGVKDFMRSTSQYGVHFSDAFITDEQGRVLKTHYPRTEEGKILQVVPQGDVYLRVISRYYICPPTMMMRREVLEFLGGYDESLRYEDFDFWIRSARTFHYLFHPAPLVKRRLVARSASAHQFSLRSSHARSTFRVCQKAVRLNALGEEDLALAKRCLREAWQCVRALNVELVPRYLWLVCRLLFCAAFSRPFSSSLLGSASRDSEKGSAQP